MKTLSWDKIQQGDEEAFRQLYEQYADLLYGYGMKIAGDETLVTEAVQSNLPLQKQYFPFFHPVRSG